MHSKRRVGTGRGRNVLSGNSTHLLLWSLAMLERLLLLPVWVLRRRWIRRGINKGRSRDQGERRRYLGQKVLAGHRVHQEALLALVYFQANRGFAIHR